MIARYRVVAIATASRAVEASSAGLVRARNLAGISFLIAALGYLSAQIVVALSNPQGVLPIVGLDYNIYVDATRRWLAGGSFYLPLQLAGPYPILLGVVLYPPNVLLLLIPFTVLPAFLWWAIPIVTTAWITWSWKPSYLSWAAIVFCLTIPTSWWRIEAGNPLLWIVASTALATRFGWPAVAVLLKPSLFPFAIIGIRTRAWWAAVGVGLLASLPFLPIWADYGRVLLNAQHDQPLVLYSLGDVPLMAIPILAWLGRRSRTP